MQQPSRRMPLWASFAIFAVMIGCAFFLKESYLAYQNLNQNTQSLLGDRTTSIAEMAAAVVNAESHQTVVKSFLEERGGIKELKDFKKIQRILRRIRIIYRLENDISTLVWLRTSPPQTLSRIISGNRKARIGKSFIVKPEAFQVFKTKKAIHTPIYKTDKGTWISAFAPVKDDADTVIAVVAVQFRADTYLAEANKRIFAQMGTSTGVLLVFFVLLSIWFAKKVRGQFPEFKSNKEDSAQLKQTYDKELGKLADKSSKVESENLQLKEQLDSLASKSTKQASEIAEKNSQIETINALHQNIVDCFSESCLVFRKDGSLASIVSQNSDTVFGRKFQKGQLWDLLQSDESKTKQTLQQMFSGSFEVGARKLPNAFTNSKGVHVGLRYFPFKGKEDRITGVVVIGTAQPKTQSASTPLNVESMVPKSQLFQFAKRLSSSASSTEIKETFLQEFLREPISTRFKTFQEQFTLRAEELNKKISPLSIKGGKIRVICEPLSELFEGLKSVLVSELEHAIEPAPERLKLGKPPVANIQLSFELMHESAAHTEKWLLVNIEDDGRGLSPSEIRNQLNQNGKNFSSLSDFQVLQLILDQEIVKNSGLKTQLHLLNTVAKKLGGQVELQSTPGRGIQVAVLVPYKEDFLTTHQVTTSSLRAA